MNSPKYQKFHKKFKKVLIYQYFLHIISLTEPDTPLNDADHVGSFNFRRKIWETRKNISRP